MQKASDERWTQKTLDEYSRVCKTGVLYKRIVMSVEGVRNRHYMSTLSPVEIFSIHWNSGQWYWNPYVEDDVLGGEGDSCQGLPDK